MVAWSACAGSGAPLELWIHSSACQHDHWRRGHEQICEEIHRGGGAEQYHADKKYKEAVAVAVEACAEDTTGQRCYICFEGAAEEGLVRRCSCRGASGVAHVSCLARQAKILIEEAEERLKLDAREAEEAERLAALEAVARTAPPQPPPAMSRREQLFARPLTGRSRLDNMVAAGLVEEDDEDAWAADLEEELFS